MESKGGEAAIMKKLFKKAKNLTINDAIALGVLDEPIMDVLIRMNTLGYKTIYSCCGYDYPDQGVKDHTCAYISFGCNFERLEKLHRFVSGYWLFQYYGKNLWHITNGCEHSFSIEKERTPYQVGLVKWCWPAIREALDRLEKR
jgi:NADH:ubiquinone oxidoreductase subunit C